MKDAPSITGIIIFHYRILSKLGAGGIGEVSLAADTRLGRKIALKLHAHSFIHTASGWEAF